MRDPGLALGGFMAVGKSSVGARVAVALGRPFVDLDLLVEQQAGMPIARIFALEGEPGFRRRERIALGRIPNDPPVVLALGGGTLHQPSNLDQLRHWRILVLHAPFEELEPRLGDRPLVASAPVLYQQRLAGYTAAGVRVDVSGCSIEEATHRVLAAWERMS